MLQPHSMNKVLPILLLICIITKSNAQTFSTPVGIATSVGGGVYNITPASVCGSPYHCGAIWCTTTVDFTNSFTLTFQASFDHAVGPGADGIDVAFGQNITPTSINGADAYLGYYNPEGGPINPDFNASFGVEFDIFDNSYIPYFDDIPGVDHTAICTNGIPTTPVSGPVAISPFVTSIKDGLYHNIKITWCPLTETLNVYYDDSLRLSSVYNYAAVFSTPSTVHWGITGGTGLYCSNQLVENINLSTGTCSVVSASCDSLSMPDSLHICKGDTITMPATLIGTDSDLSYTWTPATGLSSTTILHPVLTATTSGWYYLTVQSLLPYNLVVNGDFSAGNTGFTSSYTYVSSGAGELVPESVYAIVTDPYPAHPAAFSFGDHTTGTGNMMAINGASTPISVWCETIPVTPNTNYNFSAWVANWSNADVGTGVPVLQFQINGTLIGSADAITAADGVWTNFFATWNSGVNTTASICIYDETTAADGNDFALDDISFTQICVAKDSVYVKVNIPDTTYTHTDTTVCGSVPVTLTAPAGYISYLWNTGSTSATIIGTSPGQYWVYDSSVCAILVDTFHIVAQIPDTTYTHSDTSVCANIPFVTLIAPAGYFTYLWNTGSTSSTIAVNTTGTYWVYDSSFCAILIDTFNVVFRALPVVSLGNDTSFCKGDSVILTSVQPAGDTYLWNTGSTGDSIHVSVSGTYWLTVTGNGCNAIDSIHILVSPIPLVNLGPDTTECSGQPIVLQSSYTYAGATYLWSNTTTGVTTTATATGTYWLQVTVGGCSGADTINVSILYDTFTLYTPSTTICKGASVQVLVTGNPVQTYQWSPTAGIPVPDIGSPIVTPDTSATYTVTVYYPGCPNILDSVRINVQPVPIVYLGGNRSVCEYDTIHITPSVTPQWYTGYIYSWSPATSLDNTTSSTVVFTAGDSTKIILTVTTPAGCTGIDSAEIIVHPDNFVHFDTSLYLCPGDSVQLKPISTGGGVTTYLWHPALYINDSGSATPWVHPLTSQSYWAIATSQYGCLDTISANIVVQPAAVLYLGDSVTLYPGQSYQMNPQTNCVTFMWLPPAGLSGAFISDPIATPDVSTKYIVYGTTEWGCKISDSINIYVDPETLLALPNAFTPGNGSNNLFKILKNGIATLNYFRVYNRWGNLVYESNNIDAGWDGTYNGQPQPFDVYVYEVEAVTSTGKIFHKAGNVTLIR